MYRKNAYPYAMKVKVSYCIHGNCYGVGFGCGGYEMEVGENHLARICALCIVQG